MLLVHRLSASFKYCVSFPDSRQPLKQWIILLLILGVMLVCVGLSLTFTVSSIAGVAPLSIGAIFVAIAFCLYLVLRKKTLSKTIQVAATPLPQPGMVATSAPPQIGDRYPTQISAFPTPATNIPNSMFYYTTTQEAPPPSYAEATMKE